METIKIHGKDYVMVKDRVLEFNKANPTGAIKTEMVKNDEVSVVFKATVVPDLTAPERCFTGYAESSKTASGIEGQSPIEVAETSAIGRALAAMGIGVIESYASADEVAVKSSETRQNAPQATKAPETSVTIPECEHGVLARRQTKKPGANQGRYFYTCSAKQGEQCEDVFVWEDELLNPHEAFDETMKKVKHDEDLEHPEPNDDNEDRINQDIQAAVERDRDVIADVDRRSSDY